MGWKFCNGCKRSYSDTGGGGCTNSMCTEYSASIAEPSTTLVNTVPTKPSIVPIRSSLIPKRDLPPKKTPTIKPVLASSSIGNVDVEALQWINKPEGSVAPIAVPISRSFTLTCYRGEKSEWWPEPQLRLACGMTVYEPWEHNNITELWERLIEEMRKEGGGTPAGFAQHLRGSGKSYAVATARSRVGAFEGYSYEIEIPNVRTFHWGPGFTLGPPANFLKAEKKMVERSVNGKISVELTDSITADYIVLNADTIANSTILGFGHKTSTYEVTFMHDIPIEFIKNCNNQPASALRILSKSDVEKLPDIGKNRSAKKLLR